MSDRSADIKQNLGLLYEQLAGKEKAMILAPTEDKVRIQQQIANLKQEISQFEAALQNSDRQGFSNDSPEPVGQSLANFPVRPEGAKVSRIKQLRSDRLQGELEQLAAEYQAVSAQVLVTLDPVIRVKLERQLAQLETKMEAIEADLNA